MTSYKNPSRCFRQRCEAKGFTLIEVLVALLILAIALTAVVLTVERSVRGSSRVWNKMAAHWVAMNVVASMQVGLLSPPIHGTRRGESRLLGRQFVWVAGVDQSGNGYYERIYVEVRLKGTSSSIERLIAFLKLRKLDELPIVVQ